VVKRENDDTKSGRMSSGNALLRDDILLDAVIVEQVAAD
jgi:hypothetical protein